VKFQKVRDVGYEELQSGILENKIKAKKEKKKKKDVCRKYVV